MEENEMNARRVSELSARCEASEQELDETRQVNAQLKTYLDELKVESSSLIGQFEKSMSDKCSALDTRDDEIRKLTLELTHARSQLDECALALKATRVQLTNREQQGELQLDVCRLKENEHEIVRAGYEACLAENKMLNEQLVAQHLELNKQISQLNMKVRFIIQIQTLNRKMMPMFEYMFHR